MNVISALSSLTTPMGEMLLHVRIDGELIRAEDKECTFQIVAIKDKRIGGGFYVSLQLDSTRPIGQLHVQCRWATTAVVGRGTPEAEPGINALRWNTDTHTLLLATDDVESLRKKENISPKIRRDLGEIPPELDHLVFGYLDDGLSIRLTELVKGEGVPLQFLVAWDTLPESASRDLWSYVLLEPWGLLD